MKWLKDYQLFKESKTYSNKNLITEICVSMVLLNNEFLDNILDRGLKARYSESSEIFLTDLKNLLLAKNRLQLGKFENNECIEDDELSKINGLFEEVKFDIEKDWNLLVNSRNTARNIIDKLLPDEKLSPDRIRKIYWIGPNKTADADEDIVIELNDGKQYSFYLNKNISSSKSSSFNTFAEELIGTDLDKLFSDEYLPKWNKLVQQWVTTIYENANKNIQSYIERFIDPKRIDTINYFEYFDIRHSDPKYKHLGEFFKEFNKNILKFSDLMNEIWKNKEACFMDPDRVNKDWTETKIVILNSKILENLFTNSLKSNFASDIERLDDGMKLAGGVVKMKLFKTIVEKMGCLERPLHYINAGGSVFHTIPSREFFRKFYDELNIKFDYHVNFTVSEEEDNNDFNVKIILEEQEKPLITFFIQVKFSGGEMSGKLSAKSRFELAPDFNYIISKKSLLEE
jgi:hypothetical protein